MQLTNKNLLAIITGASGTFGRSITQQLTTTAITHGATSLSLLLHGREASLPRLYELGDQLDNRRAQLRLRTSYLVSDFEKGLQAHRVEGLVRQLCTDTAIDYAFLINNAGVLCTCAVVESDYVGQLGRSFAVNVVAPAVLISAFSRSVPEGVAKCVVNVSSLAARQAFATWGAYSVTKAAGDMLHATVAAERRDWRVLCYAPGPMATRMTKGIASHRTVDPQIQNIYATMQQNGQFVCPDKSATKLMRLLLADKYTSGQHIDFYDPDPS